MMENKRKKLRAEEKKNQVTPGAIKIAEVIYGTRALVDCMEAVIKLHMGK